MSRAARIAVVGAGIAGLEVARQLRRRGGAVVAVYDGDERAGGLLGSSRDRGYLKERAANGFLGNAPGGGLALCRELGVETAPAGDYARRRWIYLGGRLRPLPASPGQLLSTDLLSRRGKLRALAEPLRRPGSGEEETVAGFFRRRFGPEVVRAVVGPFVTGIFAGDAEALSLPAAFPRLAALEGRGGLLVGAIRKRSAARRRGEEPPGPARLVSPARGMEALVEALAAEIGGDLHPGAPVVAVEESGGRVGLRFGGGGRERFDAAVLAVPAPAARRLVGDLEPELGRELSAIPYVPVAAVHLGYRREDVAHPLDGFGFLVAEGEEPRILGALFESSIFERRAPEGRVLIRCLLGGSRDPEVVEQSEEELVEIARWDLARVLGVDAEPELATALRWPRAIPQYTLGHLDRVERAEELAGRRRLALAGSAYRGVSVNDCIAGAARVAERAASLADRGAG